jgi:hypothetical protein
MKVAAFVPFAFALLQVTLRGENLLIDGGFEFPAVDGRLPALSGGNPVLTTESSWARLVGKEGDAGGKLTVGLTNELAHSGKQSLFVDFERLTAPSQIASLMTKPVGIKPSANYKISIWGRMDRERPLALDERTPFMQIDIDFLQADQETITGEGEHAVLVLPGAFIPGGRAQLLFVARRWNNAEAVVTTPENAAFMRVTWSWATPRNEGETDGKIYWDDAAIEETTEKPQTPQIPTTPTPSEPRVPASEKAGPICP